MYRFVTFYYSTKKNHFPEEMIFTFSVVDEASCFVDYKQTFQSIVLMTTE